MPAQVGKIVKLRYIQIGRIVGRRVKINPGRKNCRFKIYPDRKDYRFNDCRFNIYLDMKDCRLKTY